MEKINKDIDRNIKKARKFVVESSGDRPELSRKIGIGLSWLNMFAIGHFKDPGFSKVTKILSYIKGQ